MVVRCIWEHHGPDTLLWCVDLPGAYARGEDLSVARKKMQEEVGSYLLWLGEPLPGEVEVSIVQEIESPLRISDADSDVLFFTEKEPLSAEEYGYFKELTLRSARDFQKLFESIPDENASVLPRRKTFYGDRPRTAREMYDHTRSVNSYYFGEIGVDADNDGSIVECRQRGFAALERQPDFLTRTAEEGSYDEWWSLRKVLRRFLWHDRIHARAMYRMACRTFGEGAVENVFCFSR